MDELKLSLLVTSTLSRTLAIHEQVCQLLKGARLYTAKGSDELRLALLVAAREALREQGHPAEAATIEASRLTVAQFGNTADASGAAKAAARLLAARKNRKKRS
ncbi:MAG: hypothetical protein A2V77_12830 [Anaeromyxobacter sp. RBG_16_69_14]|nr:MAG: hypothetical protein A2V77_12830 [Anaeromyxobacter sp. RBG_16_69_14]